MTAGWHLNRVGKGGRAAKGGDAGRGKAGCPVGRSGAANPGGEVVDFGAEEATGLVLDDGNIVPEGRVFFVLVSQEEVIVDGVEVGGEVTHVYDQANGLVELVNRNAIFQ